MWKNIVQPDRPQMTKGHMRFTFRVPKATNRNSVYVILIAFLGQRKFRDGATMLRLYDYVRCLACFLAVFEDLVVNIKA
jgi:hypothetical protein